MPAEVELLVMEMGRKARAASRLLAGLTTVQRNAALLAMADALESARTEILAANALDVAAAEAAPLSRAAIDRLRLDENRLSAMASAISPACASTSFESVAPR